MIDWTTIDTVLLDMDGTLLDKHFDDYFWEHYVPEVYAMQNGMDKLTARKMLLEVYKAKEGTLDWTDLDYWSEQLKLDIPALKLKVDHLIDVHPYVIDFLFFLQECEKKIYLVTNAHSKTLDIKMNKTELRGYFDRIICAEEIGLPKEDVGFWEKLHDVIEYDKNRTLLAEDTETILYSAQQYGIKHLIYVARPSSRKAVLPSEEFPSIVYFKELISSS